MKSRVEKNQVLSACYLRGPHCEPVIDLIAYISKGTSEKL